MFSLEIKWAVDKYHNMRLLRCPGDVLFFLLLLIRRVIYNTLNAYILAIIFVAQKIYFHSTIRAAAVIYSIKLMMKCTNTTIIVISPDAENQVTATDSASPQPSTSVCQTRGGGALVASQVSATADNNTSAGTNSGNNDVTPEQEQPIRDLWPSSASLDSDDDSSSEDDSGGSDSCQRNSRTPEVRLPRPTDAVQFDAAREIVAVSTRRLYRSTIFLNTCQISTPTAEQRDGSDVHLHEVGWTDLPADQRVMARPPFDDQSWSSDVAELWLSDEELEPVVHDRKASEEPKTPTPDDEEMWESYDEELWASAQDGDILPPSDEKKMSALTEEDPGLLLRDHENVDTIVAAADETVEAMAEPAAPKRRSFMASLGRRLVNAGRKMFCCGVGRKRRTKKL